MYEGCHLVWYTLTLRFPLILNLATGLFWALPASDLSAFMERIADISNSLPKFKRHQIT